MSFPKKSEEQKQLERDQRAQHTCQMNLSSLNCYACNTGVPFPHATVDEIIEEMLGARR